MQFLSYLPASYSQNELYYRLILITWHDLMMGMKRQLQIVQPASDLHFVTSADIDLHFAYVCSQKSQREETVATAGHSQD